MKQRKGGGGGRRLRATVAAERRGKRGRATRGIDSRPQLGRRWSEAARPRQPAGGGGGGRGGATAGSGGGQGGGKKGEEGEGIALPLSPWVGMERGGGATVACDGGRSCSGRRRWDAGARASGGGRHCGVGSSVGGPIYRRDKAAEGAGRGGGRRARRAALMALGGAGARFAVATRRLGKGGRAGEDKHVEGPTAVLGVGLCCSSGEAG